MTEYVYQSGGVWIEKHDLPNGGCIFYKDGPALSPAQAHSYWREHKGGASCSGRVPGISTISKCDGETNNDGLLDWAAKLDREGVAREASLGLSLDDPDDIKAALAWLGSGESIGQTLESEKATWRDIRRAKGNVGTASHDILERLARGENVAPANGYDRGVIAWWEATRPRPLHVEVVVYSEAHGFAGRFDLMCDEEGNPLDDLKTSKWVSASHAIQLNLYRIGAIESGYPTADELAVIQVREDGGWREIPVPVNEDWALAALCSYKAGKELSSMVRAATKSADWVLGDLATPLEAAA